MSVKEQIATEAGLSFQRELIKQSEIPLTGATCKLRGDIEAIDPKAWEAICYAVADAIIPLLSAEVDKVMLAPRQCKSIYEQTWEYGTDIIPSHAVAKSQIKAVKDLLK